MNLRVHAREDDVTFAEALRTSQTQTFFGGEYVRIVERLNDKIEAKASATFAEIDGRSPQRRKVTFRDVAMLYGQRPKHPQVWHLSPYEFTMYWRPKLMSYPKT